jgi:hypothetical protein
LDSLLKHNNNITTNDFIAGYKAIHGLDSMPQATPMQMAASPARRSHSTTTAMVGDSIGHAIMNNNNNEINSPPRTARATRTNQQTRIINTKIQLEELLLRPFDIYTAQTQDVAKSIALRQLETKLFASKATDDTAMIVDNTEAPTPETLQQLITKGIAKATSSMQKEIQRLHAAITNKPNTTNSPTRSKHPNTTRGRSSSPGASTQKRNTKQSNTPNRNNNKRNATTNNRGKPRRGDGNNNRPRRKNTRGRSPVDDPNNATDADTTSSNNKKHSSRNKSKSRRSKSATGSTKPRRQSSKT